MASPRRNINRHQWTSIPKERTTQPTCSLKVTYKETSYTTLPVIVHMVTMDFCEYIQGGMSLSWIRTAEWQINKNKAEIEIMLQTIIWMGVNASSVFLNHIRQTNCCWQKNIQITSLYISPGCGSPWGLHLSSGWSTMHLAEMYFISFPEFPELFLFKSNVHYVKTKQHLGLAAKGTVANTPLNSVIQISM